MIKRIAVLMFLVALSTIPADAGVLRTLGHAGCKIGKSTVTMAKDVGKDLLVWIF